MSKRRYAVLFCISKLLTYYPRERHEEVAEIVSVSKDEDERTPHVAIKIERDTSVAMDIDGTWVFKLSAYI